MDNCDVLFLTNNDNTKTLFEWISNKVIAVCFEEKLTLEILKKYNPGLVISYNYKYIIPEDCIEFMNRRIINLHISYLPWNKGSSPNIWSFIEDTPKGVTIHEMSKGLDAGDIIYQEEVSFDVLNDTLASSYEILNDTISELLKRNWDDIISGNYQTFPQEGKGSYHTLKDLREFSEKVSFNWNDRLIDFIDKVKKNYLV